MRQPGDGEPVPGQLRDLLSAPGSSKRWPAPGTMASSWGPPSRLAASSLSSSTFQSRRRRSTASARSPWASHGSRGRAGLLRTTAATALPGSAAAQKPPRRRSRRRSTRSGGRGAPGPPPPSSSPSRRSVSSSMSKTLCRSAASASLRRSNSSVAKPRLPGSLHRSLRGLRRLEPLPWTKITSRAPTRNRIEPCSQTPSRVGMATRGPGSVRSRAGGAVAASEARGGWRAEAPRPRGPKSGEVLVPLADALEPGRRRQRNEAVEVRRERFPGARWAHGHRNTTVRRRARAAPGAAAAVTPVAIPSSTRITSCRRRRRSAALPVALATAIQLRALARETVSELRTGHAQRTHGPLVEHHGPSSPTAPMPNSGWPGAPSLRTRPTSSGAPSAVATS